MGSTDVIDVSCDEEEHPTQTNHHIDFHDFKFLVPLASVRGDLEAPPGIFNTNATGTATALLVKKEVQELSTSLNGGSHLLRQSGSASSQNLNLIQPICRQFWKSGDYEVKKSAAAASHNGRNSLCINPRFLHSNATSHKWAFGAIAELLDDAIDEFDGIGDHGTKIIVYNLWHNDDGNMELDFNSDSKDIVISGARKPLHHGLMNKDRVGNKENFTQKNVATRLRYSLRVRLDC